MLQKFVSLLFAVLGDPPARNDFRGWLAVSERDKRSLRFFWHVQFLVKYS